MTAQSRKRRTQDRGLILVAALAIVVSACAGSQEPNPADAGITIVVSTTIWGDVARSVVGADGTVQVLVPLGVDPHDYQASSSQVADINRADLVIVNGFGLEENMTDVFASAEIDGVLVLNIGPSIEAVTLGGADSGAVCDQGAEVSGCDPHFWMDPDRASVAAALIADALAQIDDSVDWLGRADEYVRSMEEAVDTMENALSSVPVERRKLVTNHDSLQYFADRFGFEVIATVIPGGSTLADPSSADLANLVETMRNEGINVIFADTTDSTALADAVAAELGESVTVVELFTGSVGEPGSGAETLIGLLTVDAERIAAALQ
jgi:zinc/manganese transport system substrate-binding protein